MYTMASAWVFFEVIVKQCILRVTEFSLMIGQQHYLVVDGNTTTVPIL